MVPSAKSFNERLRDHYNFMGIKESQIIVTPRQLLLSKKMFCRTFSRKHTISFIPLRKKEDFPQARTRIPKNKQSSGYAERFYCWD